MTKDQIRNRLEQERTRLVDMREGLEHEHGGRASEPAATGELSSFDQHDADQATETFEREKDESIIARIDTELAEVERAFEKLEQDRYGVCEACGRPIGRDRLDAFPAARFCIDDQAQAEETGPPATDRRS